MSGYVYVDKPASGPSIVNSGTFTMLPGTEMDDGVFNNTGQLVVPASSGGTAMMNGVEFSDSGSVSVGKGSSLNLFGGQFMPAAGVGFTGGGTVQMTGGERLHLTSNLSIGSETTLALAGPSADFVGTGNFVGSGRFLWTAGWMMGHLEVAKTITTEMSGPEQKRLAGEDVFVPAVLNLAGPTAFSGGQLNFVAGNAVLNNSGTFTMTAGTEMLGTNAVFNNNGPLVVPSSSAGTATMDSLGFNNSGAVSVGKGSTLKLTEGEFSPAAGVGLSGAGTIEIAGGQRLRLASNLAIGSETTLALTGANADVVGTGNFVGSGRFSWTTGWMKGHLDVAKTVTTEMTGPEQKKMGGENPQIAAVLSLAGPTTLSGTGGLWGASGHSVLNNSGTFTMMAGSAMHGGPFNNSGSLVVPSSSAGMATMDSVEVNNSGSVSVKKGSTLRLGLGTGYIQSAGVTGLSGGTLSSVESLVIRAGALSGHGTVAGSVENSGTVIPGTNGGVLKITGAYTQTSAGMFEEHVDRAVPRPGNGSGRLDVAGSASLAGGLKLVASGAFAPSNGQRIRALTYRSHSGRFGALSGSPSYTVAYDPAGADLIFSGPVKPRAISPPVISGATRVGQRLSASTGVWSGTRPLSISYHWQRCSRGCVNIPGASSRYHTPGAADVGTMLRVLVAARNGAGSAQTHSRQVGPVAPSVAQVKAWLLKHLAPSGKAARIEALLEKGGYTYSLKTLSGGRVTVEWYYLPRGARLSKANTRPRPILVATGKASFSKARAIKLTVNLTATGKRMLYKTGNLKLTAKATYTPTGNTPTTTTKRFKLKR